MSELEKTLRARIADLEAQLEARGSAEPVASKEFGKWAGLESLHSMPDGSRLYLHQPAPAVAVPEGAKELVRRIADWELPESGKFWDNDATRPMSYSACYGSNGERDYMRSIANKVLVMISAAPTPPSAEPDNPHEWILEKLSYHKLERDDLTIDECLDYLATEWTKVHGRTTRQLVMQILGLLAEQPDRAAVEQSAKLIMDFVGTMIGAYESGFVDTPVLTLGQLYQVARNHVKDEYGIDTKSLTEEMGAEFAAECNPKPQRITEQDAREILQRILDEGFTVDIYTEIKALLAKLNENREPDYKAQRDEIIDVCRAVIHLEDEHQKTPSHKYNFDVITKVSAVWTAFRAAIAKHEGGNNEN